jgi:HEPN domain-containing protein
MDYVRPQKMQLSPSARRFLTLAWAVTKGFFWPVAIAVSIVMYGVFGPWQPTQVFKDGMQAFFAILFFIMFFFGQYKRVEKQTDDKDSFKSVSEQLSSLQELVRKIPAERQEVSATTPVYRGDAGGLLAESRKLLGSGHTLAALLQAGVAFEHALRAFARHFKGEESARLPLHDLIRRMAPKEMSEELHALRQIRNRLTHISEAELTDLPDAERVLNGYERAVSELNRKVVGVEPTVVSDADACPRCGRHALKFTNWGVGPLGPSNAWYQCANCNYRFQTAESSSD